MICSVSGYSTPHSTLLVFVLTWLPRRWGGGCSHHSHLGGTSASPWMSMDTSVRMLWLEQEPCSPRASLLQALWGLISWVWMVLLEPQPLRAPVCICSHSLSLQGSDWPSKMITSTLFFCILIHTEEVGAVKLYVGGNLNTGLFGVVKLLTAFNTQLVILKNHYWDSDLKECLICYISKICK